MTKNINKRIKELRQNNNRTQEELAAALGVTSQAVSRWETGKCVPNIELVPEIADYFGITLNELFECKDDEQRGARRLNEITERLELMIQNKTNVFDCIKLAREGLLEFPENDKIAFYLAKILYDVGFEKVSSFGFLKKSEHTNNKLQCPDEFREALKLFERLLKTTNDIEIRDKTTKYLIELYSFVGLSEKAEHLIEGTSSIDFCREILSLSSSFRTIENNIHKKTLMILVERCIYLMLSMKPETNDEFALRYIHFLISLFESILMEIKDEQKTKELPYIYLRLANYCKQANKPLDAFAALDKALNDINQYKTVIENSTEYYVRPFEYIWKLFFGFPQNAACTKKRYSDLPWWGEFDYETFINELQADPNWNSWLEAKKQTYIL